VLTSKYAYEVS